MVLSYSFETEAAIKALLHACKHPSATVTGVFIGTAPSESVVEGDAEESSSEEVKITDYIPLFHTQTCIGPCCESALRQASPTNFVQPALLACRFKCFVHIFINICLCRL
jgi:Uncharacterised protein family (UPF0172)